MHEGAPSFDGTRNSTKLKKKNDPQYYKNPQSKHKASFEPIAIPDQTMGKTEKDGSLFPENHNRRHITDTLLR